MLRFLYFVNREVGPDVPSLKTNMKKVVLLSLLAVLFCACGGRERANNQAQKQTQETQQPKRMTHADKALMLAEKYRIVDLYGEVLYLELFDNMRAQMWYETADSIQPRVFYGRWRIWNLYADGSAFGAQCYFDGDDLPKLVFNHEIGSGVVSMRNPVYYCGTLFANREASDALNPNLELLAKVFVPEKNKWLPGPCGRDNTGEVIGIAGTDSII